MARSRSVVRLTYTRASASRHPRVGVPAKVSRNHPLSPERAPVLREGTFTRPEGRFIRRSGTPLTRADDLLRLSGASPRRSDGSLTRRGRPLRPGGTRLRVSRGPLRRAEQVLRHSDPPLCVRHLPASASHVSLRLADPVLRPSGASLGRVDPILRPSGGAIRLADRLLRVTRRPLWARDRPMPCSRKPFAGNRHGCAPRPVPPWARGQPLSPCLHSAASHRSAHGGQALGTTPTRTPPSARAPCRSAAMGAPLGRVHRAMSVSRGGLRRVIACSSRVRVRLDCRHVDMPLGRSTLRPYRPWRGRRSRPGGASPTVRRELLNCRTSRRSRSRARPTPPCDGARSPATWTGSSYP